MPTAKKNILTIAFLFLCLLHSFGQNNFGKLVLKIKQDKNNLWHYSSIISKDTTIELYQNNYKTKTTHDSIPKGNYKLSIHSDLGDKVEREISIGNYSKQTFKVKSFYTQDTSANCFIDRMTVKDTLRILIREWACFHSLELNCLVTKQDSSYCIHFLSSNGKETYTLSPRDLETIRTTEKTGRIQLLNKTRPKGYTITTRYFFSLNQSLLIFNVNNPNILSKIRNTCREQRKDGN